MGFKYRDTGISGYTGRRTLKTQRFRRGRKRYRKSRFVQRVEKVINNKVLEKSNLQIVSNLRLFATTPGTQSYGNILIQNSYQDLLAMVTQIQATHGGSVPFVNVAALKYTIVTYKAEIDIKNQSNVSVIVDMYECRPRFDQLTTPSGVFQQGMSDQVGTGQDVVWGCTPFQSNMFCVAQRIMKKTRYLLAPGACEHIDITDKRDYTISYERFAHSSTVLQFKGWTRTFMFIVRGECENDSTTKTNVNSAPCAVDFLTSEVYYYNYDLQNYTLSALSSTLGTITTGSSVLIDTGAIVVPTTG